MFKPACAHTQHPETSSSIENLSALGGACVQGLSSSQRGVCAGLLQLSALCPGSRCWHSGSCSHAQLRIALAPLPYTLRSPMAPGGAPRPLLHSLQQGSSNTAATDQFWKMEMRGQILLPRHSFLFLPVPDSAAPLADGAGLGCLSSPGTCSSDLPPATQISYKRITQQFSHTDRKSSA